MFSSSQRFGGFAFHCFLLTGLAAGPCDLSPACPRDSDLTPLHPFAVPEPTVICVFTYIFIPSRMVCLCLGIMKIYLFLCGDSGRVCIPEFLLWTRGLIFCSVCVSISPCSPSLWVSATHLWVLAFSIRCPFLGYQPFEAADSLIRAYFPGGVSTISLKVTVVGDLTGWHILSFSYHSHI